MFLSLPEAAAVLCIPVYALRDMCERGMIEGAVRFGKIWTIPEDNCTRDVLLKCAMN